MSFGQWAYVYFKGNGKKSGIMVAPCARPWWPSWGCYTWITHGCQWALKANDLRRSLKISQVDAMILSVTKLLNWLQAASDNLKSKRVELRIQLVRRVFLGNRKAVLEWVGQELPINIWGFNGETLPGLGQHWLLVRTSGWLSLRGSWGSRDQGVRKGQSLRGGPMIRGGWGQEPS